MMVKDIETEISQCTTSVARPCGCSELWAGNEVAHRSLELAGLQADVIALPSGADSGGDLAALFSCSDNVARVFLADCAGHGYVASQLARHIRRLLDEFVNVCDTGGLLNALNDECTLDLEESCGTLRMTTAVTALFDPVTAEFNFAYAGHPRMLIRPAKDTRFYEIGRGLINFPLGYIAGEHYLEQSVRLDAGDMILVFSDGATEVESPSGKQLTVKGLAEFATTTMSKLSEPLSLHEFSRALLCSIQRYHGGTDLEDDITLLTLRRSGLVAGEKGLSSAINELRGQVINSFG